MIKTININLSGIVFHINEDAYGKLKIYLSSIRSKFSSTEGGDEIISDIESRIAELFSEKLTNSREVIESSDVEDIINIMGSPEEYEMEEEDDYYSEGSSTKSTKRLFRDGDNKILGGVSAGLGAYFDIDPLWIRIIWILLFFGYGFGFLIYIILWVITPEAITTAEKLEMKGDKVNIENIEKKIKEEFEDIKDSFNKMGEHAKNADYAKAGKRAQSILARSIEMILSIAGRVLTVIFKVLGVALILVGVITIPALIFGLYMANNSVGEIFYDGSLMDIMSTAVNSVLQLNISLVLGSLIILIPILLLVMLGIRILTRKSRINTVFVIVLVVIWFASISGVITIVADNSLDFSTRSSMTEQEPLMIESDTIIIKTINSDYYTYGKFINNESISMRETESGSELLFNEMDFDIQESRTGNSELRIKKYARGKSRSKALKRVKAINYSYTVEDNQLILNDYFSTPAESKMRDQELKAILFIPVGTVIYFEENMNDFVRHIDNINDYWGYQMLNHYWIMTEDGLECLDCNDSISSVINTDKLEFKKRKSIIFDSKIHPFSSNKLLLV